MKSTNLQRNKILYLEDAPADTNTFARGLSKAFVPNFEYLKTIYRTSVILQTHNCLSKSDFHQTLKLEIGTHILYGLFSYYIVRTYQKLPFSIAVLFAKLHAKFIFARIKKSKEFQTGHGTDIFAPIGADIFNYVRALEVSKMLDANLSLYFVDDIQTHPDNKKIANNIERAMYELSRPSISTFTVTDDLGDLFRGRYGTQCRTLPLAVKAGREASSTIQNAVYFGLYLGSINHLTQRGLGDLISATKYLRDQLKTELHLRIVADRQTFIDHYGNPPNWIHVMPCSNDIDLYQAILSAQFSFVPYSFEKKHELMAKTSFPSKMMDYLKYSRIILTHCPSYSTPYKILNEENVLINSTNYDQLVANLLFVIDNKYDYTVEYENILRKTFSISKVSAIVNE